MIGTFRNKLRGVVVKQSLNITNWKSEAWKDLLVDLNQDILNDAFLQLPKVISIFEPVGLVIPRKCKQMSRITKKVDEVSNRGMEFFKVLSDFVAGRIHCRIDEMPSKIDSIKKIVTMYGGIYYLRGEDETRPYGSCMKDNMFTDITQYMYIFLDDVHYPIELQIGHEFASYTFTIDSALRDDPKCGLVDLWTNGFYDMVKKYLFAKANKEDVSGLKHDIWDMAFNIHGDYISDEFTGISDEFRGILSRL